MARAFPGATSDGVVKFIREEIVSPFRAPEMILTNNDQCFSSGFVADFATSTGIRWMFIYAYAAQANGRAERFVGTLNRAITRSVLQDDGEWDSYIPDSLYGYRRRRQGDGYSPFELIYGSQPRLPGVDPVDLIAEPTAEQRQIALLASTVSRALRCVAADTKEEPRFSIGDQVLVLRGPAMGPMKWPAFRSKWQGPCHAIGVDHPMYHLKSEHGRVTRKKIHVKRLQKYYERC